MAAQALSRAVEIRTPCEKLISLSDWVSHVVAVPDAGCQLLLSPVTGLGGCLWMSGTARAVAMRTLKSMRVHMLTVGMNRSAEGS
jgi:hypothetical protein